MEIINERILLNYIREYIENDESECDYSFSINNPDWKRVLDCHISLYEHESLLLAARWANEAEKAIAENESAEDYNDLGKIILKVLSLVKGCSTASIILEAYQLLISVWSYNEALNYPIQVIENKISESGELRPPYASSAF